MGKASQKFDRDLFGLKIRELSRQMQIRSVASDNAAFQGGPATGRSSALGGSALVRMVDGQLFLLNEWLEGIDRIAREVWQTQGEAVTPEFVRDILVPEAIILIDVRKSAVEPNVTRAASQFSEDPYPAEHHLATEIGQLKAKVSEKYEIEVRTLEHRQARKPRPRVPEPVRTVSTSGSLPLNSTSKPSEVPHDPPSYFPSDLWPQTNVVLLGARRKFPQRTQTLELCKYIVAQMTRIFVEAVRTNKIKAGEVQRENGGGMEDLLHSLLVHNDDGIKGGFSSLSNQAYELGKRVRESDEWAGLAEAIAEADRGTQTRQGAAAKSFAAGAADEGADDCGHRPVAFISYSWDSETHKKWVLDLAYRLRGKDGVEIILDRWHLQPGDDRAIFMEKSVRSSDFVILICTPDYARKANCREGGVGYEATIITGELADNINQGKFIPILRDGDWKSSLPVWIKTKLGVNLRDNPYSDEEYQNLLRALHSEPLEAPPVGPKPVFGNSAPDHQDVEPPEWAVRTMQLDEDLTPYDREAIRRKLAVVRIHAWHPQLTVWLTNRSDHIIRVTSVSLWHSDDGRNHKRLSHGVPSDNKIFVELRPRTEEVPIAFVTDEDAKLKLQSLDVVEKHLAVYEFSDDVDVEVRVEYDLLGVGDEYRETVRVRVHGNRQIESL